MKKTLRPFLFLAISFICLNAAFIGNSQAQTGLPIVNVFAGVIGGGGFSGDGGLATSAVFNQPQGVAVDNSGNVYIADELNNRIRRVHGGFISTIAGSSLTAGYGGDGGPATAALLNAPFGIAVDTFGNIFVADNQNFCIRKINTSGIISTIGGIPLYSGYTGDGTPATASKIGYTQGLCLDPYGNIFFSDNGNHVVRKINTAGIISTVAGTGVAGFGGDGGPATLAQLNAPRGLKADGAGNIYIADNANNRIRKVDAAGIITTIAGCTTCIGGTATATAINTPGDVALDGAGNIYFTNETNGGVFKIPPSDTIKHVAGVVMLGMPIDGCIASTAEMNFPRYLACDGAGNVYTSVVDENIIVKISNNHSPSFISGHTTSLTMCSDTLVDLAATLSVIDSDNLQSETWTTFVAPTNGTFILPAAGTATGAPIGAAGAFYIPTPGFVGTDFFTVIITDCKNATDTITITMNVANCSLGAMHVSTGIASGLSVYPNPTTGAFTCNLAANATMPVKIKITNVLGEQVKEVNTITNNRTAMQLDQAPGLYYISAYTSEGVYNTTVMLK